MSWAFPPPRTIFHHPVIAILHIIDSRKEKKRPEETP